MKKAILVLLAFFCLVMLSSQRCAGVKKEPRITSKMECKNQSKVAKKTSRSEKFYNDRYAELIDAKREIALRFTNKNGERGRVLADLVTDAYVIEGGLDKRSSLDSVQQVLFFSYLTGKKPVVVIYDTDGKQCNEEFMIEKASEKAKVKYCSVDVSSGGIMRSSGKNCPFE